jgi:hypothetical protein
MAHSSTSRRTLFMHSAHRTIGVSGDRAASGPYFPIKAVSIDDSASPPLQVALAASHPNAEISLAQVLFEQAIKRCGDAECCRVNLNSAGMDFDSLNDADCVVVFERGLHMARHLSDIDLTGFASAESAGEDALPMTVEVTPENRWHPVLMGVEPFMSRLRLPNKKGTGSEPPSPSSASKRACEVPVPFLFIPPDATVLLNAKSSKEMQPAAWVRHRRHGRAFHTVLGSPRDFRQPAFVHLIVNALTWIGQ